MQTVFKTGNSLAVTIPADFADLIGIRAGQKVKCTKKPEKGKVVYTFTPSLQLPLSPEIIKTARRKLDKQFKSYII